MQIFTASYLLPISGPPIAGGAIAVADGVITAVGTADAVLASCQGTVTEYPGSVLMPGLVNAHTHLSLTHFPSWKIRTGLDYMPRTYTDWILQVVKIVRGLSIEERRLSLVEGIEKLIESGTTAVGDIVADAALLPSYKDSPLHGRLLLEIIGQDSRFFPQAATTLQERLAAWPDMSLKPGLSPHTPHTVAPDLMKAAAALARSRRLPLVIHLAEAPEELPFHHDTTGPFADTLFPYLGWEQFLPKPGKMTPTAYLDSLGVLGPDTTAVHAVHLTPADASILKGRGSSIILCPRSNERLNVGKAPVFLFKKLGIPLALGTDSLASNDNLSLWDELRFLLESFPGVFTPSEALAVATQGGAHALGLESEIGTLEQGKRADFIVMQPGRLPEGAVDVAALLLEESIVHEVRIAGTAC